MPTYEYRCEACGRSIDVVQGFHDAALTTCEECGGTLRKVFAPVGIVFKGSGFYKNDSRASSTRATSEGSKEESGGPSAKEPALKGGTDTTSTSSDSSSSSSDSSSSSSDSSASKPPKAPSTSSESAKSAPAAKPTTPSTAPG